MKKRNANDWRASLKTTRLALQAAHRQLKELQNDAMQYSVRGSGGTHISQKDALCIQSRVVENLQNSLD